MNNISNKIALVEISVAMDSIGDGWKSSNLTVVLAFARFYGDYVSDILADAGISDTTFRYVADNNSYTSAIVNGKFDDDLTNEIRAARQDAWESFCNRADENGVVREAA